MAAVVAGSAASEWGTDMAYDINAALSPFDALGAISSGQQAMQGFQTLRNNAQTMRSRAAMARALQGDRNAMADVQDPEMLAKLQEHFRQQDIREGIKGFYNTLDQDRIGVNNLATLASAKPKGFDTLGAAQYAMSQGGFEEAKPLLELAKLSTPAINEYFGNLTPTDKGMVAMTKQGPVLTDYRMPEKSQIAGGRVARFGPTGEIVGMENLPMTPAEQAAASTSQQRVNLESQRLAAEQERLRREYESRPVDADTNAPWMRVAPASRDKFKQSVQQKSQQQLDDLRQAVMRGRGMVSQVERFGELNRQRGTGGLSDKLFPWSFSNAATEMESISAKLTPGQREPGSGTTSDMDLKMFKMGVPSIDKPGPTNQKIREQIIKTQQEYERTLNFKERFLQQKGYLPTDSQTRKALSIPEKAANALLENPSLAPEFDRKYGAGSAKLIRGQ